MGQLTGIYVSKILGRIFERFGFLTVGQELPFVYGSILVESFKGVADRREVTLVRGV
jgi:hypothetical protein